MKSKNGFTLIELLVVVLIIGILAAIALPQYKKAVQKARLSEVDVTARAFMNAIDLYLLANGGYPSVEARFTGENKTAELDINISCATEDDFFCKNPKGWWRAECRGGADGECYITFADNPQNPQLESIWFEFSKRADRGEIWELWDINGGQWSHPMTKTICDWWKRTHGEDKMYSKAKAACGISDI